MTTKELLTEYDAIAYLASRGLDLSIYTLRAYRYTDDDRGPAYRKIAGFVRYAVADLDDWISGAARVQEDAGGSSAPRQSREAIPE